MIGSASRLNRPGKFNGKLSLYRLRLRSSLLPKRRLQLLLLWFISILIEGTTSLSRTHHLRPRVPVALTVFLAHPTRTSSRRSSSHNTLATASVPPLIEAEG